MFWPTNSVLCTCLLCVLCSLCNLLAEAPGLRVSSAEYGELLQQTAARLWLFISDSDQPAVIGAACRALAGYKIEDYTLKDIPEVASTVTTLHQTHAMFVDLIYIIDMFDALCGLRDTEASCSESVTSDRFIGAR